MARSLKVRPELIPAVKMRCEQLFPYRKGLAHASGKSLATISNYLAGKPVDYSSFAAISECLDLHWQDIMSPDENDATPTVPDEDKNDAELGKEEELKPRESASKQAQVSSNATVTANGERSVGGNVFNSNIVTGDGNTFR
jgi:transcriptional regulator with XRE-family HTH domain